MKKHHEKSANEVATNRKARHDYNILETYEAGIELTGTEIKSIRARKMNIKDGFVQARNGEMWLENVNIAIYDQGNQFNHDPLRNRRLLLHKKEIRRIAGNTQEKGITVIPLKVYLKNGFAKVLIGVAEGKKQYDKRETIKKRDQEREIQRATKVRY
ncbi:SsrA-binding protein SmpB [Companilactobacillus ginsenosidimutans]|uniref:SsrA-binding protein n=1 Tax=Companilactobacillus ginsenosidimutans TaxID=1007676 RepID=A0A0H4QMB8_9LACO|nr:SsrA-binding protein SmpB [Companilactobacillus ginsenosidimutans]AKP68251.1 single-stranded DNA-binding protein [Companilactobacillus ginsenosidimutans]